MTLRDRKIILHCVRRIAPLETAAFASQGKFLERINLFEENIGHTGRIAEY